NTRDFGTDIFIKPAKSIYITRSAIIFCPIGNTEQPEQAWQNTTQHKYKQGVLTKNIKKLCQFIFYALHLNKPDHAPNGHYCQTCCIEDIRTGPYFFIDRETQSPHPS